MSKVQLSVIVPCYRVSSLEDFWQALSQQEGVLTGSFELILIDNDPDGPLPLPPVPSLPFAARVVVCKTPGSYAARNAGAQVAKGDHLVFTDADCLPAPKWLAHIDLALRSYPRHIIAGDVLLDPGMQPTPWAIFDTVRGIPQAAFVRRGYAATANLALSRALFEQLGGFDPARLSGGDAEFCRRAGRYGVKLRFVSDAIVHHPARATWSELATKARRIKGGQVATGPMAHRLLWTLRSFAPPLREMVGYLTSPHPWQWRLTACKVRLKLWRTELSEIARLLILRRAPERR